MERTFGNLKQLLVPSLLRSKSLSAPKLAKGPQGYDDVDGARQFTASQEELLKYVREEDMLAVEKFFKRNQIDEVFDINENDVGRTALKYAIDNNDLDIIDILLREKAKIGGALFTAVREGSKEIVEKLLNCANNDGREDSDYIGPEDVMKHSYMSPLILAVHLEEHEIVELFVANGYRIKHSSVEAEAEEKEAVFGSVSYLNQIASDSTGEKLHFLRRVNVFKALANPLYLSYRYIYYTPEKDEYDWHPIFKAFMLNGELDNMAGEHFEFRHEYKALSDACEDYAVELLEQCRTVKEIDCLMNVQLDIDNSKQLAKTQKYITVSGRVTDAAKLTVLNLALRNKNDKLVAHPYSQLQLNMVLYQQSIYSGLCRSCSVDWRRCTLLGRLLFSLAHTFLLPFLALVYIIAPCSSICEDMKTPIVKFLSHTGAFAMFLFLLILSAFQDEFDKSVDTPTIVEWVILIWVIGLAIQEVKEWYNQGTRRYYSQWWNFISLAMVTLFTWSYILRLTAYGITGNWGVLEVFDTEFSPTEAYKVNLWANSLFSGAMVLSFFHILSAFQVNAFLGPLQLSLYKLIGDMLKFLLFFGMVFLSFAMSLRKLYSHYVVTQHHIAKINSTTSDQHQFAEAEHGFASLFWSVFGLTDLSSFETQSKVFGITSKTGQALFGLFQLITVIVAVNMLIAMMTRSFESIAENQDLRWKVSRTRMWMNWVDKGSDLPSPFNLIPNPKNVTWLFRKIAQVCCHRCIEDEHGNASYHVADDSEKIELNMKPNTLSDELQRRRKVLRPIVERYLHKRKQESHQEDLEMLRWIKASQEEMWKQPKVLQDLQVPTVHHRLASRYSVPS